MTSPLIAKSGYGSGESKCGKAFLQLKPTPAGKASICILFSQFYCHRFFGQAAEHAVERRLWERTRMELTSDIKKRDEIAERVETYTYTILERYHKLQRELKVLRENSRIETKK